METRPAGAAPPRRKVARSIVRGSSEGYLADLLRSAVAPEPEAPQEPPGLEGAEAGQSPTPSWRNPA